jgi:hypothetical protein
MRTTVSSISNSQCLTSVAGVWHALGQLARRGEAGARLTEPEYELADDVGAVEGLIKGPLRSGHQAAYRVDQH